MACSRGTEPQNRMRAYLKQTAQGKLRTPSVQKNKSLTTVVLNQAGTLTPPKGIWGFMEVVWGELQNTTAFNMLKVSQKGRTVLYTKKKKNTYYLQY